MEKPDTLTAVDLTNIDPENPPNCPGLDGICYDEYLNDPRVSKNITDSYDASNYCYFFRNSPDVSEVWRNITESAHALEYVCYVKDRPEVAARITDSAHALYYCHEFADRENNNVDIVKKNITDRLDAMIYCLLVKDDPVVKRMITCPFSNGPWLLELHFKSYKEIAERHYPIMHKIHEIVDKVKDNCIPKDTIHRIIDAAYEEKEFIG